MIFSSQLNIHRFKVIARFGLMHVVATNLCVWIRTLVLESLKEITQYHKKLGQFQAGILGKRSTFTELISTVVLNRWSSGTSSSSTADYTLMC